MPKNLINFYLENEVNLMLCNQPQDRFANAAETPNELKELNKVQESNNFNKNSTNKSSQQLGDLSNIASSASGYKTLEELYQAIRNFKDCELKKTAINTVIGDGDPNSDIVFIGEAPGRHEDEQGIPFCGQSGKLLDQIILSLGYQRKEVYITNTVFWRPPGNRRPTPEEINLCKPFVEKHIELLNPKIIILVGSTAVESLLGKQLPMKEVRQKVFEYSNQYLDNAIKMFAIFHPSYLLRQPIKKKEMWRDMQFILKRMEKSSDVVEGNGS